MRLCIPTRAPLCETTVIGSFERSSSFSDRIEHDGIRPIQLVFTSSHILFYHSTTAVLPTSQKLLLPPIINPPDPLNSTMYPLTTHEALTTRSIANWPLTSTAQTSVVNTLPSPWHTPEHTEIRLDVLAPGSVVGPIEGLTIPVVCTVQGQHIIFSGAISLGRELGNTEITTDYIKATTSILNSETNWPIMREGMIQAAWELENPKPSQRPNTHEFTASRKIATLIRRLCDTASPDLKPPGSMFANPVYPEYMTRLKHGSEYQPPQTDDLIQEGGDTLQERSTKLYRILKAEQEASFMSSIKNPQSSKKELRHTVVWRNPETLKSPGSDIVIAWATPHAAARQKARQHGKKEAMRIAKNARRKAANSNSQPAQTMQGSTQLNDPDFAIPQNISRPSPSRLSCSAHQQAHPSSWRTTSTDAPCSSNSRQYPPSVFQTPEYLPYSFPDTILPEYHSAGYESPMGSQSTAGLADPPAAYPINPAYSAWQPTASAPPNVSRSAQTIDHFGRLQPYIPPTLLPIDPSVLPSMTPDAEAWITPHTEFIGEISDTDQYYGRPSRTSQTLQTRSQQYSLSSYAAPSMADPATTLNPAYDENVEAGMSRYGPPVNFGSDVNFFDQGTISLNRQHTIRVGPSPHPFGTYDLQPQVSWNEPPKYDAWATQRQPTPPAAPSTTTRQSVPSIHDHLLGGEALFDELGRRRMSEYKQFGNSGYPSRVQGPRKKRGEQQDRPE